MSNLEKLVRTKQFKLAEMSRDEKKSKQKTKIEEKQ